MIPQFSEGFPGIKIDESEKKIWLNRNDKLINYMTDFYENVVANNLDFFAMSNDFAKGFHYFCKELESNNGKLPILKGQVIGPFTFGLGINDSDGKALWFCEQYHTGFGGPGI